MREYCLPDGGPDRMHTYEVNLARPSDVSLLPAIELAAATLLKGCAPDSLLEAVTSDEVLRAAQRDGHLWVARTDGAPVGFAHVRTIEVGSAHLEELDVHPDHGHRGLGRRLVATVCAWAVASGHRAVTLTTLRDSPWNVRFYASMGFEALAATQRSAALESVVQRESSRGLDADRVVAMRRELYR